MHIIQSLIETLIITSKISHDTISHGVFKSSKVFNLYVLCGKCLFSVMISAKVFLFLPTYNPEYNL